MKHWINSAVAKFLAALFLVPREGLRLKSGHRKACFPLIFFAIFVRFCLCALCG